MTPPVFLVAASLLVDASVGDEVVLDGSEGRHAAVVRRLRAGEPLILSDGDGCGAKGCVVEARADSLLVRLDELVDEPDPAPRLVVVQALVKGERGELAVELATEVGADEVVPWAAERCIVRWEGDRGAKALARWRSSAREAAKQARRLRVPQVAEQAGTSDVAALIGRSAFSVVLHEGASQAFSALQPPAAGTVVLVVGPEGGITDDELAVLGAAGAVPARLGPTVMRASTAGVAGAAALLVHTRRWA